MMGTVALCVFAISLRISHGKKVIVPFAEYDEYSACHCELICLCSDLLLHPHWDLGLIKHHPPMFFLFGEPKHGSADALLIIIHLQ